MNIYCIHYKHGIKYVHFVENFNQMNDHLLHAFKQKLQRRLQHVAVFSGIFVWMYAIIDFMLVMSTIVDIIYYFVLIKKFKPFHLFHIPFLLLLRYAGLSTSDSNLYSYAGVNTNTFSTNAEAVLITFSSGEDQFNEFNSGFTITYSTAKYPITWPMLINHRFCAPLTELTSESNTFSDGSQNWNYKNGTSCSWLIDPQFSFSFLELDYYGTLGTGDVATIYDGSSAANPVLAQLVGTVFYQAIGASGKTAFVTFNTVNTYEYDEIAKEKGEFGNALTTTNNWKWQRKFRSGNFLCHFQLFEVVNAFPCIFYLITWHLIGDFFQLLNELFNVVFINYRSRFIIESVDEIKRMEFRW